jgi:hypothetical protein
LRLCIGKQFIFYQAAQPKPWYLPYPHGTQQLASHRVRQRLRAPCLLKTIGLVLGRQT